MKKKIIVLVSALSILLLIAVIFGGQIMFGITVKPKTGHKAIYIPTGASYLQVLDTLKSGLTIKNFAIFKWMAERKGYPSSVKSGKYVFNRGLSYYDLLIILRTGRQTPVRLTFNNIRTLNQLAGKMALKLEPDSSTIMNFFNDEKNYSSDGFTKENIISVFIPDTYEFWWNIPTADLYKRMLKEYRQFWTEQRISKAGEKGLTPIQVTTLASIIDDESAIKDEKPRIAGVYINRLKRGMPLQADPTVKFALNDFSITSRMAGSIPRLEQSTKNV